MSEKFVMPSPAHKASFLEIIGNVAPALMKSLKMIINNRIPIKETISKAALIGYESLPMIMILIAIGTSILTLNTSVELVKQGGRDLIGALIITANLREIVPIFIAFGIAARCGTSFTAEVSTMKVSDQIDVLKVLKIDPIYYLLVPALFSVIILSPLLLSISAVVSVFTGMSVAKLAVNLEMSEFLESAWKVVTVKDYIYPLIKTEIFCIYAVLVNIVMGLMCEGGAREVGITTTKATAIVVMGVILLDGILTPLLYL
jgi:phospholipid/cholesterol/gamma-HCH transport system permease protein